MKIADPDGSLYDARIIAVIADLNGLEVRVPIAKVSALELFRLFLSSFFRSRT
jgi:exosome complex RNA-binding protein Rrp42 (RNase PH superfamily)